MAGVLANAALANAPDPVLAQSGASVVVNGDGTKTLTVQGKWVFSTQTGDCSLAKRAAGFAIDWNDASQPGNNVGKIGTTSIDVGAAAANTRNPADNLVHPTPPSPTFPNPPYGGCGTFSNPPNYSSGAWGQISHTYPATQTTFVWCVVLYDVHLKTNGGSPTNTTQVTAGGKSHNGDNSVQGNTQTPLGNECSTENAGVLTTRASANVFIQNVAVTPLTDTATLSGVTSNAGGTITFKVYGPGDTSCATAKATFTASVNGPKSYTSGNFVPTTAGVYQWVASYSGDSHNSAITTACNDTNESTTVQQDGPLLSTQASASILLGHGTLSDAATLSGGDSPTGKITFSAYGPNDSNCSHTPAFTTMVIVNGNGTYPSGPITPTAGGTYRWIASYSGDVNNTLVATGCNDPGESAVVTVPSTLPPSCVLASRFTTPKNGITVMVFSPLNGVQSIVVNTPPTTNADVTFSLTPGQTTPITVTAQRHNNTHGGFVRLTITDTTGLRTVCDPPIPATKSAVHRTVGGPTRARDAGLTLSVASSQVAFGSGGVTLTGKVPSGRAGEGVTILGRVGGFPGASPVATVRTGAGGVYRYRIEPALTTVYSVRLNGMTSRAVQVAVQPLVSLRRTSAGHYAVDVTTTNGVFLDGTLVALERWNGKVWVQTAATVLAKNGPVDTVTAISSGRFVAPAAGTKLRARVLPSAPYYTSGASAAITG